MMSTCSSIKELAKHIHSKCSLASPNSAQLDHLLINLIDAHLAYAGENGASDIHFEPCSEQFRIRLRVHGILSISCLLPKCVQQQVATRLKILSNLDIAQKTLPQDGKFIWTGENNRQIQFRINSCPTQLGEKIVLRLTQNNQLICLDQLGMSAKQIDCYQRHLSKQQGLVIVTGPTGSGKTTTLYAALGLLNNPELNIVTIEDPIEQTINGVNQANVHHKAGLTCAKLLRAYLRQDPDVIMVGEIRDQETAEIALKAAQTGHLVLATLHANSAIETIQRLENMGLDKLLIADCVSLIISQRMVKQLCKHCKKIDKLNKESTVEALTVCHFFEANGCQYCHSGYDKRIALFEILEVRKHLEILSQSQLSLTQKQQQLKATGHQFISDYLLKLLKNGEIDLKEYLRYAN